MRTRAQSHRSADRSPPAATTPVKGRPARPGGAARGNAWAAERLSQQGAAGAEEDAASQGLRSALADEVDGQVHKRKVASEAEEGLSEVEAAFDEDLKEAREPATGDAAPADAAPSGAAAPPSGSTPALPPSPVVKALAQIEAEGMDGPAVAGMVQLSEAGMEPEEMQQSLIFAEQGLLEQLDQIQQVQELMPPPEVQQALGQLESLGLPLDKLPQFFEMLEGQEQAGPGPGSKGIPHQAQMERAFGADFSALRTHQDPAAQELLERQGAHAMAVGEQLFLPPGASPELLAHELTHVVQQQRFGAAPQRSAISSKSSDSAEKEAEHNARALKSGEPLSASARPMSPVMRDAKDEPWWKEQKDSALEMFSASNPVANLQSAWSGVDPLTGKKLGMVDRVFAGASIMPGVSPRMLKAIGDNYTDEVQDLGSWVKANTSSEVNFGVDLASDFVPVVSNIKDATIALTGVNPVTGEKSGPIGRIFAGICAIPGAGNLVKFGVKGIGKGALKLLGKSKWISKGLDWAKSLKGPALKAMSEFSEWGLKKVDGFKNMLQDGGERASKWLGNKYDDMAGGLAKGKEWAGQKISQIGGWFSEKGSSIKESIFSGGRKLSELGTGVWTRLGGAKDWLSKQMERGGNWLAKRFPKASQKLSQLYGGGKEVVLDALRKGKEGFGTALETGKGWLKSGLDKTGKFLGESKDSIVGWAQQKSAAAGEKLNSIKEGASSLWKKGSDWFSSKKDGLKEHFSDGLKERIIGDAIDKIEPAIWETAGKVKDFGVEKVQQAKEKVTQAQQWAGQKLEAGKQWAGQKLEAGKQWVGEKANQIKESASKTWSAGKETATKAYDNTKKWVGDKAGKVGEFFSKWF